jgi:hypothetical protein
MQRETLTEIFGVGEEEGWNWRIDARFQRANRRSMCTVTVKTHVKGDIREGDTMSWVSWAGVYKDFGLHHDGGDSRAPG